MNYENCEMRLPEEGTPTGAGPGTRVNASGQRSGNSRRPDRGNPETQSIGQRSRSTTGTPPTESATQNTSGLTQAGLPRRRLKWTHEMNVTVLEAYYMATRSGNLPNYRQQMHEIFIQRNPHLSQLTQQNLADRRATIFRNNLIPPTLREEIRLRVTNQHSVQLTHDQPNTFSSLESSNSLPTSNDAETPQSQEVHQLITDGTTRSSEIATMRQEEDILTGIKSTFNEAKIKFLEMEAQFRPKLPKHKPSKKMYEITSIINKEILPTELTPQTDYNQIVGLTYCCAYTITQLMKPRTHNPNDEENSQSNHQQAPGKRQNMRPIWEKRLQGKINSLRKDLGFLTCYNNNMTGRRANIKLQKIKRRHAVHTQFDPPNSTVEQLRDTVRQKLKKYSYRMRVYTKSYERAKQNKVFQMNEKKFYNMMSKRGNRLEGENTNINMKEVEDFWKDIWSRTETHNPTPTWINTLKESVSCNLSMETTVITDDIFRRAICKLHNWKQPGVDKLHNYYYKYLTSLHSQMVNIFNRIIMSPEHISPEMCMGVTYLKPKVDNPSSASQFRPITCLNTGYKIFTSCIATVISNYCERNNILAEEQKGCRQGTKGCKDQLVIDSVATKQAIRNRKNMYTAYIDYQKAFDSVPHSWLIDVLKIYKIDLAVIKCIKRLMTFWRTTLIIQNGNNSIRSRPIKIQCGIYQGDSLSPLIFCLALNPLSLLLQKSQYGYNFGTGAGRISHCFYMDDLKLYASTKTHRDNLLRIVDMFSCDINMKFGIEKCRTQNITKGKYITAENFETTEHEQIRPLLIDEHYKYLGIMQHITIDHKKQKERVSKEFLHRINIICRSKLNGRNLVKAINTYAIPLLTYTFGVIAWSDTDLNNIGIKIRTIMTKNKCHHPKASVERTHIPRKLGGRGILNIKLLHDRQVERLAKYFKEKAAVSNLYRIVVNADDNITPLNLKNETNNQQLTIDNLICNWRSKPLHGKYPNLITQPYVDTVNTNNWLKYGNVFAETEGFIVAIQDGVIPTRNYRKYILHDATITNDNCRRCGGAPETIPHLLNSCTMLLQSHFKQRHDNVGKIIHINIIKKLQINEQTTFYYRYQPKPIIEDSRYIIYWDRSILINNSTNTTIPNRPDMVIINKQLKIAQIIDFAIPYDNNIQETIVTKKTKYIQLAQYIKNTQDLIRVEILPIVVSSMGTIPMETTDSIRSLSLNVKILTENQKSILIRAATIMRETIQ